MTSMQDIPWSEHDNACLECYEYFCSFPGLEWHQAVELVNSMTSRRKRRSAAKARQRLQKLKLYPAALPKDKVSMGTSLESSLLSEYVVFNPAEFLEYFNVDHVALKLKPNLTHVNEEGVTEELFVFRSNQPRKLILGAKKSINMQQRLMRHVVREGQATEFFEWPAQTV